MRACVCYELDIARERTAYRASLEQTCANKNRFLSLSLSLDLSRSTLFMRKLVERPAAFLSSRGNDEAALDATFLRA